MSADLSAVAKYHKLVTAARAALDLEVTVLASLEMKNGQDFGTNLTVCGKKFVLVEMGHYYYAERVKALDVIRLELIQYQKDVVSSHQSGVDGLEWRLRQAAAGVKE